MTNIMSFVSIKGGVGKTTLALETATSLAKNFDKKVLLIDANFSAPNIGLYLDLTSDLTLHDALDGTLLHNTIYEAHGIDIVPASMEYEKEIDPFKLKKLLQKYKTRYDFIIIDSSPSLNEELLSTILASDHLFVVSTPDYPTLSCSLKTAHLAKQRGKPISGIIINKLRLHLQNKNYSDFYV